MEIVQKEYFVTTIDFHDAIKEMYKGKVVQYVGTTNGNIYVDNGSKFCMCRGVVFLYIDGEIKEGGMVYDPDFRYKITNEVIDTRQWPIKRNQT